MWDFALSIWMILSRSASTLLGLQPGQTGIVDTTSPNDPQGVVFHFGSARYAIQGIKVQRDPGTQQAVAADEAGVPSVNPAPAVENVPQAQPNFATGQNWTGANAPVAPTVPAPINPSW